MNERIAMLILALKEKGIKQYEFAEKLGVTETAVSAWKNGRRNLTQQTINAICREFNVDYLWLTTGSGDMFVNSEESVYNSIDRIMASENELHRNILKWVATLDDKDIEDINRMILKYLEASKKSQ